MFNSERQIFLAIHLMLDNNECECCKIKWNYILDESHIFDFGHLIFYLSSNPESGTEDLYFCLIITSGHIYIYVRALPTLLSILIFHDHFELTGLVVQVMPFSPLT